MSKFLVKVGLHRPRELKLSKFCEEMDPKQVGQALGRLLECLADAGQIDERWMTYILRSQVREVKGDGTDQG